MEGRTTLIYLFDKDEKLVKIVKNTAIKTALQKFALTNEHYISDRLDIDMKAISDTDLAKIEYVAIQSMEDSHTFHYFWIAQKQNKANLTTIVSVQSGIEELQKTIVKDIRPQNKEARPVIDELLLGTNWIARVVEGVDVASATFYYISTFEALKKVCEIWGLEMQFFVEMNGNKVGGRYIDFKKKIGVRSGKRVVYGHNALEILQEIERTNIYTALIGRGKGEQVSADGYGRKITFADVVWDTPVAKPKGQEYVELPNMTALYGIKNANGTMRPKIGFVEFQEETDPAILLKRTYNHLVNVARPQVAFKTSAVYLKGVKIGDTVRVVRHDKKIDYETRIFEITFNRLNNKASDIKLGDNIRGTDSQNQAIQTSISNAIESTITSFVSKLPEFLPSADGFNSNWYTDSDPTLLYPGKVLINDLWFKPDSEFPGEYVMLRWTGEVWEEVIRTADSLKLETAIADVQTQADTMEQQIIDADAKANTAISKADSNATAISNANQLIAQTQSNIDATKQSLQTEIDNLEVTTNQTITDLNNTKVDLLAQASSMSSLTTRMTDVETTANGTKTTVTQLSKSVNDLTGSVDGVTQEVKTVQDNLDGVYTTLSKIQVGGNNLAVGTSSEYTLSKTVWTGGTNQVTVINKVYTGGLTENDDIYLSIQFKTTNVTGTNPTVMVQGPGDVTSWSPAWTASTQTVLAANGEQWLRYTFKITADQLKNSYFTLQLRFDNISGGSVSWRNLKVEKGTIATAWTPAIHDSSIELANYKQAIDGQLTELKRTTETNANDIQTNKTTIETTVNGIKTDISALQTYVNADGTRTSAMQTYVQEETAKQTSALRTEVSSTYASKSEVTASVNGLTAKYENIRVGSRNYVLKSDFYMITGSPNLFVDFSTDFSKNATGKTIVLSYEVESSNLSLRASGNRYGFEIKISFTDGTSGYYGLWMSGTTALTNRRVIKSYTLPPDKVVSKVEYGIMSIQIDGTIKIGRPQIEIATVASDWHPADEDVKDYTSTKIAEYKQTVDQNFASLTATVGDKVSTSTFNQTVNGINTNIATLTNDLNGTKTEFQAVKETSDLYQRVLGTTEGDITSNVTNIIATSDVIQTTVETNVLAQENLVYDPLNYSKWEKTDPLATVIKTTTAANSFLNIVESNQTSQVFRGFRMPLRTQTFTAGETLSFRLVTTTQAMPDDGVKLEIRNGTQVIASTTIMPPIGSSQTVEGTMQVLSSTTLVDPLALNVKMIKNGNVIISKLQIVRGDKLPLQFIDSTDSQVINTDKDLTATKTTVTQLADSYAIKALNSSGDVLSSLNLNGSGVRIKGSLIHLDGTTLIDNGVIKDAMISNLDAGKIATGQIDAGKINVINLNADNIATGTISANIVKGGFLNSLNGTTSFDLNSGKLYFYNNNTGVFRNDQNASVMGIKFSNNQITVNNTSRTLSRVIVGGDRRETTLDDGRWDQGGFSGIIIETVKGINSPDHWGADRVNVIGDTIRFVHTYNTDTTGTGLNSMGWVMENYVGTSTIQGSIVLRPEGIDQRNSYIFLGDVRLYNGGTKGNYYLRDVIRSLRTCFQHIVNGGTSSDAINAIKSELTRYSNI